MATLIAQSRIMHGADDGSVVDIEEGSKVTEKDLPKDVIERLQELGSLVEPAPEAQAAEDELATKDKQIAELQQQLADMQAKKDTTTK